MLLSYENIKAFFENLVAERPGMIGERLFIKTLEVYVYRLKAAFITRGIVILTENCKQVVTVSR